MKYFLIVMFSMAIVSCNGKKEDDTVDTSIVADTLVAKEVSTKMLIVPGKSIGNVWLLQNADSLEILLGKPDLSDSAMGKAWLTWFSKVSDTVTGNELNIYTSYKDDKMDMKVVRQVRITSREFKTSAGISTGKSLSEVKESFPNIKIVGKYDMETNTPVIVYDDVDSGIAFEFENNTCSGIILHEIGKKVSEEYLSFHPDMKPL
jgi:hypothetical protein